MSTKIQRYKDFNIVPQKILKFCHIFFVNVSYENVVIHQECRFLPSDTGCHDHQRTLEREVRVGEVLFCGQFTGSKAGAINASRPLKQQS